MMYMVPLDSDTIAVGDIRAGVALLGDSDLKLDDVLKLGPSAPYFMAQVCERIGREPHAILRSAHVGLVEDEQQLRERFIFCCRRRHGQHCKRLRFCCRRRLWQHR